MTTVAERVEIGARATLDRNPRATLVDARQQALFSMIAEKKVRLELQGMTAVDIRVHAELAKKAEIDNLTMLYALPVVTTLLYREQGVVVTGAFL